MKNKNLTPYRFLKQMDGRKFIISSLFLCFLLVGLNQLEAQSSHNVVDQVHNQKTDADEFLQEFDIILNNQNFVSRNAAISILENNFSEIDAVFANNPLSQVEKTELVVSYEFRKFIFTDLKQGKSVRNSISDNISAFLAAFNKYESASLGIDPQILFQKTVNLLAL